MSSQSAPALVIISAMITPALLILGSASLVASALLRLGRAVDRARVLIQLPNAEAQKLGYTDATLNRWLDRYLKRSITAERAVFVFFTAVGTFVLDCLSIAADHACGNRLTWLPVSLTILGMLLMLCGAYYMVLESRLGSLQIHEEIHELPRRQSTGS